MDTTPKWWHFHGHHAFLVLGMSVWLLGGTFAPSCRASEPAAPSASRWLNPLRDYELLCSRLRDLHPPELVEMVTAVAGGSEMGPGEGWFHAGQSRYGWQWLAKRFGAHNDRITQPEFKGPPELFERLDRDHDGVLTPADFDWGDRSSFARQSMPSRMWFRLIDANSNGRISRDEWQAFFSKVAGSKDYVTADDLREAFPVSPPRPATPAKKDGPSPLVLFLGLLTGELGSPFEGPHVGAVAPDFALKTQDGKKEIRLSQYRGKKPVVLIFGSFT
jgi:hypothetical protein